MKIRLSENNRRYVVEEPRKYWVDEWTSTHKGTADKLEKNLKFVITSSVDKKTFGKDELINDGIVRFGLELTSDKTVNPNTGKKIKSRNEFTELSKIYAETYITQIRLKDFYEKLFASVKNGVVDRDTVGRALDAMWEANDYTGICECPDSVRHKGRKQFGNYACKHVLYLGDLHKKDEYREVKAQLVDIICETLIKSRKFNAMCKENDCVNGLVVNNDTTDKKTENRSNKYRNRHNRFTEDYEYDFDVVEADIDNEYDEYDEEIVDTKYDDVDTDADEYVQGEATVDTNALYADCNKVLEAIQDDTILVCHGVQVTDIIDRISRVNEGDIVDDIDRKFIDILLNTINANSTVDTYDTVDTDEDNFDENDIDDAEIEYESHCGVRRKESGKYCNRCGRKVVNEWDDEEDNDNDIWYDEEDNDNYDDYEDDYEDRYGEYEDDENNDYEGRIDGHEYLSKFGKRKGMGDTTDYGRFYKR